MDIYEIITDKIINKMEQGIIPWQRSWSGGSDGSFNRISKKTYSLLNQMLLENEGEYATFKQWVDLGGKIKKGAKSEIVVFWKMYPTKEKKLKDGKEVEEVKTIPVLKYYNVFHISQVENVKPLEDFKPNDNDPIDSAEIIINNYTTKDNLTLYKDDLSNRAFYSPSGDYVKVPTINQYEHVEEYYSTLFHELTHSTGAKQRLDRALDGVHHFGDENYSKEELVAEMGASFMLHHLGIDTDKCFNNNVAYIQSWLQQLKNDKRLIVSASSKAQKAVEYMLKFSDESITDKNI